MRLKPFSLIFVLVVIQSCCFTRGKEIGRVQFTIEEKAKLPYTDDQNVDFITNEDFEFTLNSRVYTSFDSNQYHCEDYTSYETYVVNLVSDLPTLDIQLWLQHNYSEPEADDFNNYISIEINRQWFYYDVNQPLESLEINGITYTDVYRYTAGNEESPITEVFFKEAVGILKLNYTNGDYVQINS